MQVVNVNWEDRHMPDLAIFALVFLFGPYVPAVVCAGIHTVIDAARGRL